MFFLKKESMNLLICETTCKFIHDNDSRIVEHDYNMPINTGAGWDKVVIPLLT